ncbi:MAG: PAS domain-containing sensor histidine kinase [Clostridia bacterium]|nr:PAS domain-containing sensor histidine kinase [Clostridia bacterium]
MLSTCGYTKRDKILAENITGGQLRMNENHAEFDRLKKAFEESRDSMHAAIEAANIYYFEYFPDQDYALEHNGREEFGIEERMENYPESWFEKKITHPEDEILLRKAFLEIKSGRKKAVCDVRNLIDGVYHWHHYNFTSIYDGRGERIKVVCMAQDITGEKKAEILKDEFQRLYERTPAWIFSCKNDAGWTIQRTNPRIYEMTGYTAEEFALEMENEVSRIIPDKYRVMIQSHIARMEKEGYGSKVTYDAPVFHKNGSLTWLNVDLYWDKDGTEGSFYVSCSDITKLKANEEELRENNTMYRLTTQQAHISLWKYDIVDEIIYNTDSALETHPGEKNIKNFPSSVITAGMIRQDSIPEFLEVFQKLKEGEQSVTADVWIKRRDGSGWWCERINYAAVLDENNRPYMAFGLGRDVTELKEIESRIKEEEKFQEGIENEKLLLKIRGNITLNEVDTYEFGPAMNLGHIEKKYDQVLKQIAQNGYGEEDKDTVLRMLSTARIESAIKDRGYYTFEYRRRDAKGNASWVSATIRAFYNPEDHNIMAFVYLYDINREKNKESVINRVVEIDYEVLALIYPKSNEMECIRTTRNDGYMSIDYSKPYNEGICEFIECYFEEEKREEALQVFEINNITSKLDRDGVYEISYGMQGEETYHKKWVFAYLDETKSVIIYTRSDITDLLRHQEEQQNALKDALVQAEEASNAKSNFLSRMSHEIRTPMNAIIGMNALAAQVVDNPEQVKDCLSKVGLSARFLLSLINDILDMSRIESGKTVLKNRKFPLEELVNNVNSIFYEQAVQKGIDYDCIITSFTSTYYIAINEQI